MAVVFRHGTHRGCRQIIEFASTGQQLDLVQKNLGLKRIMSIASGTICGRPSIRSSTVFPCSRFGRCERHVLERVICAHSTSASADEVQGLPSGPEATVRQASIAVEMGRNRGVNRQILELPWPLSGASELDDWYPPPANSVSQKYNIPQRSQQINILIGKLCRWNVVCTG